MDLSPLKLMVRLKALLQEASSRGQSLSAKQVFSIRINFKLAFGAWKKHTSAYQLKARVEKTLKIVPLSRK